MNPATPPAPRCAPPNGSAPPPDGVSRFHAASLIPTSLTLARLLAGLFFFWAPTQWQMPLIFAALVSDLADGAASRLLRAQSKFGQILDPIADKVFTAAVVITWLWEGIVSPGETFLVCFRDIFVALGAFYATIWHGYGALVRMNARPLGKLTTVLQFAFFLACYWDFDSVRLPLLLASALMGALATFDYFRTYWLLHRQ